MARTTNVKKKKTKKTRVRRKYSPEFKENAVKLAMTGDTTIAAVARDLGSHVKSLYDWTSKAKQQARGGVSCEEHEERDGRGSRREDRDRADPEPHGASRSETTASTCSSVVISPSRRVTQHGSVSSQAMCRARLRISSPPSS